MTLPLKFVPFERYMLKDDRPRHPMAFTIKLIYSGRLWRAEFEQAVIEALARHPLLAARMAGDNDRDLTWVASPEPAPMLDWAEAGEPLRFPGSPRMDLRHENGLRIWVRQGDEGGELRFQFHHCCCDGVGALHFIEDVLCAYDRHCRGGESQAAFRPLDPGLLRSRTRFGLTPFRTLLRLPQELFGSIGTAIFFVNRPVQVVSPDPPALDEVAELDVLDFPAHTFNAEQTARLRSAAHEARATFYDIVLRDMFVALHTWNAQYDPSTRRRKMRIMIPTSLRGPGDDRVPAANIVSMAFLDRKPSRYRRPEKFLSSIRRETKIIKSLRLALTFIRVTTLVGMLPGGTEFLARADRCYATGVLSHLGKMLPEARLPRRDKAILFGDAMLERIESAPPVRPFTSVSFSIHLYRDEFTLVMNYDRYHLRPERAAALMRHVADQIQCTAGVAETAHDIQPALSR